MIDPNAAHLSPRAEVKKSTGQTEARPFLKWAGGKQQLVTQFERYLPQEYNRYIEPFIGGGAVFFNLSNTGQLPGQIYLFDNNKELINAYTVVRDKLDDLIEVLARHKAAHCQEYYYQIRALDRQDVIMNDIERAARTIYLNKTCYNGLYRVNSKGQFNVPLGSYKNPGICDPSLLTAASRALTNVVLETRAFPALVDFAQAGDFLYFDPPYDPVSKTASFTSYTAGSFGDEDQRSLAQVFAKLAEKGCLCMLSNSHTPFILDLYQEFRIETVYARRAINSNATGRGKLKEVVVLNY